MTRYVRQYSVIASVGANAGQTVRFPGLEQKLIRLLPAMLRRLERLLLETFAFGLRLLAVLLVCIALGVLYDRVIGDGELPRLKPLAQVAPNLAGLASLNSTETLPATAPAAARWRAMAESRRILRAVAPEIESWVTDLHREGHIVFFEPSEPWLVAAILPGLATSLHGHADGMGADRGMALLGAYRQMRSELYLGREFWKLSDGEKVCVLVHEYRHARQNLPKQVSVQLARVLTGQAADYGSSIEDEAFLYEKRAYDALSLPSDLITPYLQARGL